MFLELNMFGTLDTLPEPPVAYTRCITTPYYSVRATSENIPMTTKSIATARLGVSIISLVLSFLKRARTFRLCYPDSIN